MGIPEVVTWRRFAARQSPKDWASGRARLRPVRSRRGGRGSCVDMHATRKTSWS
jgi:hypothetical protein